MRAREYNDAHTRLPSSILMLSVNADNYSITVCTKDLMQLHFLCECLCWLFVLPVMYK